MIDQGNIYNIVKNTFNEKIISVRTVYAGGMNFVYELVLDSRTIMFKAYPLMRSHIAAKEFEILSSARNQGVWVPKPMIHGTTSDGGYLIYDQINGTDLKFNKLTRPEQGLFCADLVHNLEMLAAISQEGFGNLTEKENMFTAWEGFLLQTIETGVIALADGKHIPQSLIVQLTSFMTNHPLMTKPCKPNLVWGDLKSENILVAENHLASLLDFESCFSGDPLLSLGYLFAREGESEFYQNLAIAFQRFTSFTTEDIYFYALLRLLRISKYLDAPLPSIVCTHIAPGSI